MTGELDYLQLAGTLLGGLGLFLLGVTMVTDGMKLAAGPRLRDLLARSTRTDWHGIGSGLLMTTVVQSSSAVTVATIGFVNAGLLPLRGALVIVLGAAVGTTMTGWLVAGIGVQLHVTAFALPMVGLGMLLRLLGSSRRSGALGEAVVGFGLFFIGIDFLRSAFEGVTNGIDLAALTPEGAVGVLVFVAIGLLMTVFTQSSSAAIAVVLTASAGGMLPFHSAVAAVIGATIGTTSTSALAVIAATAQARRVAAGHVLVNSANALIGLAMMPGLLWLLDVRPALADYPTLLLAGFHTTFSVCGLLLLRPLMPLFARWLEKRFRGEVDELSRTQFLDRTVLASPELALEAFYRELLRLAEAGRGHAIKALTIRGGSNRTLKRRHDGIRQLVMAIEQAVSSLESERLPRAVARELPLVLRIANYLDEATATAQEAAEENSDVDELMASVLEEDIAAYQHEALALLERCDIAHADHDPEGLQAQYEALRQTWRSLKTALLEAGANRQISVSRLNPAIEKLRFMLRVAERSVRAAIRLAEFAQSRSTDPLPVTPPVDRGQETGPGASGQGDPPQQDETASDEQTRVDT